MSGQKVVKFRIFDSEKIWIRSLIFLIKMPSRIFPKSFMSSKRVKSILISCLRPYRTRPSRRAPGRVACSLNYEIRFLFQKKKIKKKSDIFFWNSRFKLTEDTDDRISNWFEFMNDIATKLDDNNNSSLTSDAFACATCSSEKWNPSFGLALVGNTTFIELTIFSLNMEKIISIFFYAHTNFQINFTLVRWFNSSFHLKYGF